MRNTAVNNHIKNGLNVTHEFIDKTIWYDLDGIVSAPLDPERLKALGINSQVILGGIIASIRNRIITKDRQTLFFANLEDSNGRVEVNFYSDVYEKVRHLMETSTQVLIQGELQWDKDGKTHKLIASKVIPLGELWEKLRTSLLHRQREASRQQQHFAQIQSLCEALHNIIIADNPPLSTIYKIAQSVGVTSRDLFQE